MIFNKLEKRDSTGESFNWTSWIKGEDYISNNSLNEQNYLRGLNILGNTIGSLSLSIKLKTDNGEIEAINHPLNELLNLRPNSEMTRFDLFKSVAMLNIHQGSSGIFIDKDVKGNAMALYPVKILQYTIDNVGLINSTKQNKVLIDFECCGVQDTCLSKDMIILRDNSLDGINSKSTKNYIKETIDTNLKAQSYQNDLFSNGLTNKAVVQLTSDLKDEKELKTAQEKFNRLYSSKGRIFTVPAGFSINPLNLSLVDSQFAELKLSGKKDIATALGIPFSLLNDGFLTEDENISYLTNTINPILTQLEQEMDYKLLGNDRKNGYKIRFNINSMLRTSPEKQKDILIDYVKNGIYSINQAKDILGVPRIEGGDTILLPSGQVTLENLINGQATWQKDSISNGQGGDNNNGK